VKRPPGSVARLARRELSASDLLGQCLARIAEREPVVQAWEVIDAEGSLAEARRIDALRDKPSDEIVRALVAKVGEYVRVRAPEDDRTVVVVKRVRPAGETTPLSAETPPAKPTG